MQRTWSASTSVWPSDWSTCASAFSGPDLQSRTSPARGGVLLARARPGARATSRADRVVGATARRTSPTACAVALSLPAQSDTRLTCWLECSLQATAAAATCAGVDADARWLQPPGVGGARGLRWLAL